MYVAPTTIHGEACAALATAGLWQEYTAWCSEQVPTGTKAMHPRMYIIMYDIIFTM